MTSFFTPLAPINHCDLLSLEYVKHKSTLMKISLFIVLCGKKGKIIIKSWFYHKLLGLGNKSFRLLVLGGRKAIEMVCCTRVCFSSHLIWAWLQSCRDYRPGQNCRRKIVFRTVTVMEQLVFPQGCILGDLKAVADARPHAGMMASWGLRLCSLCPAQVSFLGKLGELIRLELLYPSRPLPW